MVPTALLVIDMQVGLFADGSRFDADGVVSRINALGRAVRAAGGLVVFIQHEDNGAYAFGSPERQLLSSLERLPEDAAVRKTACDSFYRSDLEKTLRGRGVRRLLVTGCATDFCVDTTLRSAASKDYEVVVVADGHTTADRPHLAAEKIIEHHNWMWERLILPGKQLQVSASEELLTTL
ncbi:MAG: isochorismatase family protein [Candidatus Bipolaricaulota bacterium]